MTMELQSAHLAPGYIASYAGNVALTTLPAIESDVSKDSGEDAGYLG